MRGMSVSKWSSFWPVATNCLRPPSSLSLTEPNQKKKISKKKMFPYIYPITIYSSSLIILSSKERKKERKTAKSKIKTYWIVIVLRIKNWAQRK